jgi:hypothetical protein
MKIKKGKGKLNGRGVDIKLTGDEVAADRCLFSCSWCIG